MGHLQAKRLYGAVDDCGAHSVKDDADVVRVCRLRDVRVDSLDWVLVQGYKLSGISNRAVHMDAKAGHA